MFVLVASLSLVDSYPGPVLEMGGVVPVVFLLFLVHRSAAKIPSEYHSKPLCSNPLNYLNICRLPPVYLCSAFNFAWTKYLNLNLLLVSRLLILPSSYLVYNIYKGMPLISYTTNIHK